jgi:hypothetical protein
MSEPVNQNVQMLQDELLNVIERCRSECNNLTIAETIGVIELIKLNLLNATFPRKDKDD